RGQGHDRRRALGPAACAGRPRHRRRDARGDRGGDRGRADPDPARAVKVAAIILAAGAGARLGGVAKAALRLPDGRSVVESRLASARAAGASPVVVVAQPHGAAVTALAGDARVVWNPAPERGMIGSLNAGIAAAGPIDVALCWPVDHARV